MESKTDSYSLNGKRVIIMGGSSGIGLATAKQVAEQGAKTIIVSSNKTKIDTALKQIGHEANGFVVDLTNEKQIENFFKTIGGFDHLVYTAGENIQISNVADTKLEDARQYFVIRYWGAFLSVKYGAAHLSKNGSITLTSGIASARPGKGWALGASICAAMEGLNRALAIELAPIRVNIVSPGIVRTDLWSSLDSTVRDNMYKSIGDTLPVGRIGEAEDVARTYLYLINQSYGTGQVITVDGGNVLV